MKNLTKTYMIATVSLMLAFSPHNMTASECAPDSSTTRTIAFPSEIQSAISSLDGELQHTFTINSNTITAIATGDSNLQVTEQDCLDDDDCECGKFGVATGTVTGSLSASSSLGDWGFGPSGIGVMGYSATVEVTLTVSAEITATYTAGLTGDSVCETTNWTFNAGNSFDLPATISGGGTAIIKYETPDTSNTVNASAVLSGTRGAKGNFTISNSSTNGWYSNNYQNYKLTVTLDDDTWEFDVTL